MQPTLPTLVCVCLISSASGFAQQQVLAEANRLELTGHFKTATLVLTAALADKSASDVDRKQFEFEIDRLERIKKDFPYTKEQLFIELKKSIRGLSGVEFEQWIHEGRFDTREIDGQRFFMVSSVRNLFFRYPELAVRRLPPKDDSSLNARHWETCVAIKQAAQLAKKPYVLPKRFQVTMSVTANPNVAPDKELIRAWLPVPREYPFQGDFEILSSSSAIKHIDDPNSSIRAAYLEQPSRKSHPTEFKIEYDYTTHGVWFDVQPDSVKAIDPHVPALQEFTCEAPHVVFTPQMRALSQQIAGEETNPYLKARKFYEWIADHIQYSFAIEYSTIRNISDYCLTKGYGDCGQEALLLITLCRLNGIPARWQSGWNTFPDAKSIHDWTELYFAPYGWVPVDPYMGIYAMRYATSLKPQQRREIRDFYFGGLDQYRMIANSDHNQSLTPPKPSMRSDNVDFQRGELEWGSHNIYFDHFSYDLTVKEIELPRGKVD